MPNEEKPEDILGTIKFSDEIIANCAMNATNTTLGVHSLGSGFSDTVPINILNKHSILKGIKVYQENNAIRLDLQINIEFGYKIPEVAWNVQENVKNEIQSMTGLKVSSVNIFIHGVYKQNKEDEASNNNGLEKINETF